MQFTVRERAIQCTSEKLIGDNADYTASFSFDAEWEGKVKTARFMHGSRFVDKLLDDNSCTIPVEVLKQGFVKVGVFSAEMTSTYCEVQIRESIKEKNGSPIAPTPDVYAQIIEMIEDMEEKSVPEEVIEKAVEDYLEEHPIESGITEEECQQIVAAYVTAHKDELKGDKGEDGKDGYTPVKNVDYFDGKDGSNGLDGSDGADGASAYDIAVNHGFVGTETEWLASLHGSDGQPGTNGTDGVDGYTPVKGVDYFTAADKAELVNDVIAALPTAESGVY